jgi:hypothetical protein
METLDHGSRFPVSCEGDLPVLSQLRDGSVAVELAS